jgi:hypothetical protein
VGLFVYVGRVVSYPLRATHLVLPSSWRHSGTCACNYTALVNFGSTSSALWLCVFDFGDRVCGILLAHTNGPRFSTFPRLFVEYQAFVELPPFLTGTWLVHVFLIVVCEMLWMMGSLVLLACTTGVGFSCVFSTLCGSCWAQVFRSGILRFPPAVHVMAQWFSQSF